MLLQARIDRPEFPSDISQTDVDVIGWRIEDDGVGRPLLLKAVDSRRELLLLRTRGRFLDQRTGIVFESPESAKQAFLSELKDGLKPKPQARHG